MIKFLNPERSIPILGVKNENCQFSIESLLNECGKPISSVNELVKFNFDYYISSLNFSSAMSFIFILDNSGKELVLKNKWSFYITKNWGCFVFTGYNLHISLTLDNNSLNFRINNFEEIYYLDMLNLVIEMTANCVNMEEAKNWIIHNNYQQYIVNEEK